MLELGAARRRDSARISARGARGRARELERPDRVEFFEIPARGRLVQRDPRARPGGEPITGLIPEAVAAGDRGAPACTGDTLKSSNRGAFDHLTSLDQARRIADLAQEKLARDVLILDMRPVCSYTDYFVVCTGNNPARRRRSTTRCTRASSGGRSSSRIRPRGAGGELDPRRLPRRRPARLHARGAGLLPARGALGRRALGRAAQRRIV